MVHNKSSKDDIYEEIIISDSEDDAFSGYYKTIGERLKLAREESSYTLADIAGYVDLTPAAISNYESGIRQIPVHILLTLANLFNKPLQYFLGLEIDLDFQISKAIRNAVQKFTDAEYIKIIYKLDNGHLYPEAEPIPLIPLPPAIADDHSFAIKEYNPVTDSYNYILFKNFKATIKKMGMLVFTRRKRVYVEPNPDDLVLAQIGDTKTFELVLYKNVTPTKKPEWQHDPYSVNVIAIATARIERLVKK